MGLSGSRYLKVFDGCYFRRDNCLTLNEMFKKINGESGYGLRVAGYELLPSTQCFAVPRDTGCFPAFSGISAALQLALVAGVAPVALVEERPGKAFGT